ncbi:hypothetical protein B0T26DRAFT_216908 [Lasiosphaeria miniovina]|uniref:Uncharacterized protein n=1 Tax=Lasiosphaeria miniovina TaxID=1954250 RepID=A0AA40AUR2_9PEZI|nr:uncharacterized protein B0T26DRAFT_216908 [Lasiosphaeria miniovina]KAK0722387.1 hypothetical protein B0T26DRAFT_216908 [Lasiosphaeria miniovina]
MPRAYILRRGGGRKKDKRPAAQCCHHKHGISCAALEGWAHRPPQETVRLRRPTTSRAAAGCHIAQIAALLPVVVLPGSWPKSPVQSQTTSSMAQISLGCGSWTCCPGPAALAGSGPVERRTCRVTSAPSPPRTQRRGELF